MFADPAVVTINGVAKNLIRIRQDQYSSEYKLRSADDELRLNIRNTSYLDKKRKIDIDRHNVEMIHEVFPVAPATTSVIRKVYVVFENQKGDTLTDPQHVVSGLLAFLTSGNITKLMNLES